MAKVITARDMLVVSVVRAFVPEASELTITKYTGSNYLPEKEWTACTAEVKIVGKRLLCDLTRQIGSRWSPRLICFVPLDGDVFSVKQDATGKYVFAPER